MRGELTIPQVFEPGARVEGRYAGGVAVVLQHIENGRWYGLAANGHSVGLCASVAAESRLRVVAPAPRAGQRWEGHNHAMYWDVEFDGMLFNGTGRLAVGSFAHVALWLLEHGYSYAGEASPALPAPPPVASLEPLAPPTSEPTWMLADARRTILDVIRASEPRRPDAFTAALCGMADLALPSERLILVTAEALAAGEAQLPERGVVASWQEEMAARAMRGVLEGAFGAGVPLLAVDACARYLVRRGT